MYGYTAWKPNFGRNRVKRGPEYQTVHVKENRAWGTKHDPALEENKPKTAKTTISWPCMRLPKTPGEPSVAGDTSYWITFMLKPPTLQNEALYAWRVSHH